MLFGDPELRRVAAALEHGLQGAESAIARRRLDGLTDACERIGRRLNGAADLVVLHDPGTLGLAAGPGRAGRLALPRRRLERRGRGARARRAGLVERLRASRSCPHQSFAPERLRGDRLARRAARHRSARPAQPRARAAPAGPGGAPARRGPRPAVRAPGDAARPLGGPAHGDRGLRARAEERRAAAGARRRCSTRARPRTGGPPRRSPTSRPGDEDCCCSPATRASAASSSARSSGSPGWRSSCRCARASASRRARRSGSAPRWWARRGRRCALQVRDGVDGYLADDAEQMAARLVGAGARPRPRGRDGRAPAASACASASWSRARSSASCGACRLPRSGAR